MIIRRRIRVPITTREVDRIGRRGAGLSHILGGIRRPRRPHHPDPTTRNVRTLHLVGHPKLVRIVGIITTAVTCVDVI